MALPWATSGPLVVGGGGSEGAVVVGAGGGSGSGSGRLKKIMKI